MVRPAHVQLAIRLLEDGPELGRGALGGAVGEVEDWQHQVSMRRSRNAAFQKKQ